MSVAHGFGPFSVATSETVSTRELAVRLYLLSTRPRHLVRSWRCDDEILIQRHLTIDKIFSQRQVPDFGRSLDLSVLPLLVARKASVRSVLSGVVDVHVETGRTGPFDYLYLSPRSPRESVRRSSAKSGFAVRI